MDKQLTFSQDLLDRKLLAINLTKIIEYKPNLNVLAIDSSWGTGKTTFVTMWINMLNNNSFNDKFETIYYNAWENDYFKDPLISLFSELETQIENKNSKLEEIFKNVKKAMIPVVKSAVSLGIRIGTAGVIDTNYFNFGEKSKDVIADTSKDIGELILGEIKENKSIRESFKEKMSEFQTTIDKKILFFIDELDRCRPTFAIELLEAIKHIFNLDNYIFVISLDKKQLSHSIKTIYGNDMDSNGYLKRFFDLEFSLPKPNIKEYILLYQKKLSQDYKNMDYFIPLIQEIFISEEYSLREIDKVFNYIEVLLPSIDIFTSSNSDFPTYYLLFTSYIYSFFINLKIKRHDIYEKIKNVDYNPKDSDYLNSLIPFKINEFEFKLPESHFSMDQSVTYKNTLSKIIPLLLKVLHDIKNKDYTRYQSANISLTINHNTKLFEPDIRDIYNIIQKENIFIKLDFANNFK